MSEHDEVRVLVVDDNRDEAESLAALIALNGYTVRTARDAESALAAIAEFEPQCLMLDLGMPGVDGVELSRRLREANHGALVVIAVSGLTLADGILSPALEHFDSFLQKPVEPERLARLLPPL